MSSRTHRYDVGQIVQVEHLPRDEPEQAFEVVLRLPVDEAGTPQYRIKGLAVPIERMVREDAIAPFQPRPIAGGRS